MKFLKSSKGLLSLAFLLIIVTNIFIMSNTYLNKLGEPTSSITLSQRELYIPYSSHDENSALSLKISYRMQSSLVYKSYMSSRKALWLDEQKLTDLGFTTNKKKEVFYVLEFNGDAYKNQYKLCEENLEKETAKLKEEPDDEDIQYDFKHAKDELSREKNASRLFVVDAGLEYKKLRVLYPNKQKYIITKGLIRRTSKKKNEGVNVYGYLNGLSVTSLHVEKKYKSKLKDRDTKFEAQLNYGSRYEPWIEGLKVKY